ncbi:MAG: T9SS type A sorting domain-containing protein, partial [Bacteroidota bacterium]
ISVELPVGNHTYMIRYIDGCDNSVSVSVPITIYDCAVPEMTCYSGLIVDLQELSDPIDVDGDGDLDEAAAIAEAGLLASCELNDCSAPLTFSVNRIGDTPNRDQSFVSLTCDDRYMVELEVYMWDDAFNPFAVQPDGTLGGPNWSMCVVEVFVQDPDELCDDCGPDGLVTIAGDIRTSSDISVEGVDVNLTGSSVQIDLTDVGGEFRFEGMESGDYIVEPYKNDDLTNGLTTFDVLILQRHLLDVDPITDPYQWLAADVNADGQLTVLDMLTLRNVILDYVDEFPNNTSWRFVDASVDLSVPAEGVMTTGSAERIVIEQITSCGFDFDFIGIKVGDLDGSAWANSESALLQGDERSDRESHPIIIDDTWLEAGESYMLPVRVDDLERLNGLQFTMLLSDDVELVAVYGGLLTEEHLGESRLDRNQLMVSWNQSLSQISGSEVLFDLELRAIESIPTTEVFSLMDEPTLVEAYSADDERMDLHLRYDGSVAAPGVVVDQELSLLQNFPNPFRQSTTIRFYMPEAGDATLELRSSTGQLITTIADSYPAGYQTIQLDGQHVPAGIYYYQLTALGQSRTRSMVRLR